MQLSGSTPNLHFSLKCQRKYRHLHKVKTTNHNTQLPSVRMSLLYLNKKHAGRRVGHEDVGMYQISMYPYDLSEIKIG